MNSSTYNILSIDGGGIRGIVVLQQLVQLEALAKDKLSNKFHLLTGTSTGGIIVTLLGLGYSAQEILNIYVKNGERIFHKEFLRFGYFRPKYSNKGLESTIKQYVGDTSLTDLKCDVIIPAYNIDKREVCFFKSTKAKIDKGCDYKLFDVVRATASAPSYFTPHLINSQRYIDGGMSVNNPAMIAFSDSKVFGDNKIINLLSFGTGAKGEKLDKNIYRGGAIKWANPVIDTLLSESVKMTDISLQKIYTFEPGYYCRCYASITNASSKIDDASNFNVINLLKDSELSYEQNKSKLINFSTIL